LIFYLFSVELVDFEIAFVGHKLKHNSHLIHESGSMECGFFASPEIASEGQLFLQTSQPVHLFLSIENDIKSLHTRAGHALSST
jgi:hypothetical protein